MANTNESRLSMADGTELFIRDWLIGDGTEHLEAQPCIVILHGLGEHCGRYNHIATFLNSCGFSVRTYDHRGHGQSSGARGDTPDSMIMLNDAETVIRNFAKHCQTQPLLFGHSMGGLFASRIATATTIPLRGLILSSPALALRLSWLDHVFLKLISSFAPHLAISTGLKPAFLSHKLAVIAAYMNDPLVHNKITASLLSSMLSAIDYTQTHAPLLTIPTLLLVAEDDLLVDPQGSHDFYDALPSNIGTAYFYDGYYHEIFNDTESAKVFNDLKSWLAARHFIH